jgi:enterochelin esterase-like enzyme
MRRGRPSRSICAAALLLTTALAAQTARPPALVSPEVLADRRVTFRLYAPNAADVALTGDWMGPGDKPTPLVRGADGVWTATVGPFEPNVYGYAFSVNGVSAPIDPSNRTALFAAGRFANSAVEIPGTPPRPWELRPVPRGTVHVHPFRSKALDRERGYYVYTPPDYDRGRAYPLLVLLPGTPGNEGDWVNVGYANRMFDNLLADRAMQPMVVLMPRSDVLAQTGTRADNLRVFEPLLVDEILPDFERQYRVDKRPEFRAIAGYSLGGELAVTVGLRRPELFRSIGSFDGSLFERDFDDRFGAVLEKPEQVARSYRVIWFGCGAGDLFLPGSRKLDEILRAKNVPHTFREIPGFHTTPTFRTLLADFLPVLFR